MIPTRGCAGLVALALCLSACPNGGGENGADGGSAEQDAGAGTALIVGCYAAKASVGDFLAISCQGASVLGPASLDGSWTLSADFAGASIDGLGNISSAAPLLSAEVGVYNFTVTADDGQGVTEPFEFQVPVDERVAQLRLDCASGATHTFLLPESSVDALATACASGIDLSQKPASDEDGALSFGVDPACVETTLSSLDAAAQAMHANYNDGDTPLSVLETCEGSAAELSYVHL